MATCEYKDDEIQMDGWHDALRLDFDDVTQETGHIGFIPVLFDAIHANQVLDFIERNRGKNFVIHCDAGMSRSVAVANFMATLYGYDPTYHEAGHDGMRNILVVNVLRRAWMRRNGMDG